MIEKTTQQAVDNNKNYNPTGKGGFGDHPEHRNPGGWDKKNSYSYWLNFFKSLTIREFKLYKVENEDTMTMAAIAAWERINNSSDDIKEFELVADRTEGKPKQMVITADLGETVIDKLKRELEIDEQSLSGISEMGTDGIQEKSV